MRQNELQSIHSFGGMRGRILLAGSSAILICVCEVEQTSFVAWLAFVPLLFALVRCSTQRDAVVIGTVFSVLWGGPKFLWMDGLSDNVVGHSGVRWILACLVVSATLIPTVVGVWSLCRKGWQACAALPTAWVLWEEHLDLVLRYTLWTTADVVRLATTQGYASPFLQAADLGGAPIVSWLVAAFNGLVFDCLFHSGQASRGRQRFVRGVVVITLALAAAHGLLKRDPDSFSNYQVLVVPEAVSRSMVSSEFSQHARQADLVVFAENSAVCMLNVDRRCLDTLRNFSRSIGKPIVVGCSRLDDSAREYLSAALISPTGVHSFADKRFPAPISDCRPPLAEWFGISPTHQIHGADLPQYLTESGGRLIGVGICHDVCFPEWSSQLSAKRPVFLLNIGNEAFTRSSSLKRHLLACARLRAVESRITVVRCIHDGRTSLIDCVGRVSPADLRGGDGELLSIPIDVIQPVSPFAGLKLCYGVTFVIAALAVWAACQS